MELIERHDLKKIHYLNSITFAQFKDWCGNKCKNEEDRKVQYKMLKDFCKTVIKTRGETKRIYSYSLLTPLTTGGRLYSGGSIQGLKSIFRGFLMTGTTDIDMKNCHPVLLRYICAKHGFPCPNLEYYINNRDEVLAQFANKDEGKTLFLKSVNDDKRNNRISNKFFKAFDREMKDLQLNISSLECYADIKQSVPQEKKYNWNGSAINRILCSYENHVLQSCISALNKKNIEICALMFDGVMPYGNYYDNSELLEYITAEVEKDFEGLNMKWDYKPHNDTIVLPEEFEIPTDEKLEVDKEQTFEAITTKFEKIHCKIINKALYIKCVENKNTLFSRNALEIAYEHIKYDLADLDKDGNVRKILRPIFIRDWFLFENIRCYDDVDIYPKPSLCPKNIFNLWTPFKCETYTEPYAKNDEALQIILHHIKILCDHDEVVYDYFIKWIAQMIQYPEVKTVCITLISKEGAGKGTLMRLIQKMLGEEKYFETTQPSRDVWGSFNSIMKDAFFVNLNELSKKETMEAEGIFKGLITDEAMTINQKGLAQYKVKSYHRFLITTNKEDGGIKTVKDDRRKVMVRTSDERIGDTEYFNKLHELLEDVNVVRTCYDYFKSIEGMDEFNKIPRPVTEYQANLKQLSRCPVETWLEQFTRDNIDKDEVELLGKETHEIFKNWCSENNVQYEANPTKIGVQLSNMKISGIMKGRKTKKGDTKIFKIPLLKQHFQIGSLIDFVSDYAKGKEEDDLKMDEGGDE